MTDKINRGATIAIPLVNATILQSMAFVYSRPGTDQLTTISFCCMCAVCLVCLFYALCRHRQTILPVCRRIVSDRVFDIITWVAFISVFVEDYCPDWLTTFISPAAYIASVAVLNIPVWRK